MITLIEIKKIHQFGALIVLIFAIISTYILITLEVQAVFPVLLLWILVPVFIKKIMDKVKNHRRIS